MAIPIVKVYAAGNSIVIDLVNGVTYVVAPVNLATKYVRRNNYTIYDDRVSLFIVGQNYTGFSDKFPDTVRDENGDKLVTGRDQTIDDVEAYFDELRIGQGGGVAPDLSSYYTKGEVDGFISAIYDVLGQPVPTPTLATPQPVASEVTEFSVKITISAIQYAQQYEYRVNGSLLYTGADTMYIFTGLQPDTFTRFRL